VNFKHSWAYYKTAVYRDDSRKYKRMYTNLLFLIYNEFQVYNFAYNMKTIIRHKAFETNSSSTHSICVCDIDESRIEAGFEKYNGEEFTGIGSGEYGWDQDSFNGFWNKLDYMFIQLESMENKTGPEYAQSGQALLDWIIKEFESRGKTITLRRVGLNENAKYSWERGEGYIDHQSVGTEEVNAVLSSQKSLLNFLFNDDCYFETDNDNH